MTALAENPSLPAAPATPGLAVRRPRGWIVGIIALALIALVLTTWDIANGSRSDYYAAIALSMSKNWSNFLFGALDPSGTVTLDKIPGSFWIPALMVKVFGFSTWAVILPNALAAVGATLLVAFTARRLAGTTAGLLAGAVVATTPILLAVSRSNQPESFFVLGLALTAWAAVRALDRRSLSWLITAGLFVALSFQTYMLEAWAVWPALAAAYLVTAQPLLRKLWHLAVAGAISLAASVVWIVVVSLVPAADRPYIGSTLGNSAWEMVFGYNGLGRFGATSDAEAYRSFTPPFSGDPGILRLFNSQLAGQIAWLVPATLVAVVVLFVLRYRRSVTVLIAVWFLTFAAMFSIVSGMHQFYTSALAVPMALAVGLAFAHARQRGVVWAQAALVAAAAVTALGIGFASGGYSIPVALAQAGAAAAAIALFAWEKRRGRAKPWVAGLAVAGMLLTPAAWSVVTIAHPSSTNPVAGGVSDIGGFGGPGGRAGGAGGPGQAGSAQGQRPGAPAQGQDGGGRAGRGQGRPDGSAQGRSGTAGQGRGGQGQQNAGGFAGFGPGAGSASAELISYLQQNRAGATYLVAAFGAQAAAPLILASDGDAVLPIGGFDSQDPAPTLARFQELVRTGQLRYVLMGSSPGGVAGRFGNSASGTSSASSQIESWVSSNCAVDAEAPSSAGQLYVCS